MIGTLDRSQKQATVVGAGVAGLLAAYHLDRNGYEVTLLEASGRAGGLIETRQTEWGIAESAAHSTLATAPVVDLFEELGVKLLPVRKDSRARYILRGGKMRQFPLTFGETLSMLWRAYFVLSDAKHDPSELMLDQWARRHLGEAALKHLMTPFTSGVFGAAPGELAVSTAFPMLSLPAGHSLLSYQLSKALRGKGDKEKKRRLKIRSNGEPVKKQMMTAEGGMESLVRRLDQKLIERLGSRYRKNAPVDSLPQSPNLILAVPAPVASRLLGLQCPDLADALDKIRYTPMVTVTVFVDRSAMKNEKRGVGVLMSSDEKRDILGVLFNSSSFEGRVKDQTKWSSFTVMMGGVAQAHLLKLSDDEITAIIRREFENLFGLQAGGELHCMIRRWESAIPHYNHELSAMWSLARDSWCSTPGRVLFGNYSGQVSLRGMIESAAEEFS